VGIIAKAVLSEKTSPTPCRKATPYRSQSDPPPLATSANKAVITAARKTFT
jgi:hypothetical protein